MWNFQQTGLKKLEMFMFVRVRAKDQKNESFVVREPSELSGWY